jgi:hypothetical protein
MKNKYNLKPLTLAEQKRWVEIKFYIIVQNLLETYYYTAEIYEVMGTFAYLFGCNITILRYLVQNLQNINLLLKPTTDECIILMYRQQYPVRKILEINKLKSMSTIYRAIENYLDMFSPEYSQRLLDEQHVEVTKFIKGLEKMLGVMLC